MTDLSQIDLVLLRFSAFFQRVESRATSVTTSLPSRFFTITVVVILQLCLATAGSTQTINPDAHPLLPGIRAKELWDPNWPRTMHDRLATGFSPLVCNLSEPPVVWGRIPVPGKLNWLRVIELENGKPKLLVNDSRLRCVSLDGDVRWTSRNYGSPLYLGDIRQDGGQCGLMGAGNHLNLIDLANGELLWKKVFEPSYVGVMAEVGDVLPDQPGLEAVVFLNHGEQGCLISFSPDEAPELVWHRDVVVPGECNERYDHHCHIKLDFSNAEAPIIWNVRRFRCRGFDARTGEMLSSIVYDIGGAQRRNYGPFFVGHGRDGSPIAGVIGQRVQIHSHAIGLRRDGDNEMLWQHYYGESYKETPGVAAEALGIADVDMDGADELIYSARDPEQDYRSFVRARDLETGEVDFELADFWGVALFEGIGSEKAAGLLALRAPGGQTPVRGELHVVCFGLGPDPLPVATLQDAGQWGPLQVTVDGERQLMLRTRDEQRQLGLARYTFAGEKMKRVAWTNHPRLMESAPACLVRSMDKQQVTLVQSAEGELRAVDWEGDLKWQLPVSGGADPRLSAADMDGDGRAELISGMAGVGLATWSFDDSGMPSRQIGVAYQVGWYDHRPEVYDLFGDGTYCLLTNGEDEQGNLAIRAVRADGSLVWERSLGIAAAPVSGVVVNAGRFLGANHPGVAVSVTDSRLVYEGTYMLDGRTGQIVWFKDRYRNLGTIMPYRSRGTSTAYDYDGDGVEDVGMDMLSYMAYLDGRTGEFVFVRHTPNIHPVDATYGGHLYNTYCPVFKGPDNASRHWFVIGGFGPFGMMKPDTREGLWLENLDYDVPTNVALVDVDGDGVLEAGYAARRDATFICRDAWTGEIEWELELPSAPNSTTITADMDGDEKGEFLCGVYCIGTDGAGQGEVRWTSPATMRWAAIADFDGDGDGEIACTGGGEIVVLNDRP